VIAPERLWAVVGGVGLLFVAVAGADNVLTWVPPDFGNREWEFGTITASFNGLLSVTLGLAMVQLWLSQTDRAWPLRVLAVVYLLLGASILAAALLYWTNVPIAWAAVPDSPIKTGLMKAIVKTSFQSVAYPLAFFVLARTAFVWAGLIAERAKSDRRSERQVGVIARG
jgi:hypothetical protein